MEPVLSHSMVDVYRSWRLFTAACSASSLRTTAQRMRRSTARSRCRDTCLAAPSSASCSVSIWPTVYAGTLRSATSATIRLKTRVAAQERKQGGPALRLCDHSGRRSVGGRSGRELPCRRRPCTVPLSARPPIPGGGWVRGAIERGRLREGGQSDRAATLANLMGRVGLAGIPRASTRRDAAPRSAHWRRTPALTLQRPELPPGVDVVALRSGARDAVYGVPAAAVDGAGAAWGADGAFSRPVKRLRGADGLLVRSGFAGSGSAGRSGAACGVRHAGHDVARRLR